MPFGFLKDKMALLMVIFGVFPMKLKPLINSITVFKIAQT